MLRKRKTKDPCLGCFMHKDLCFCKDLNSIETKTRVSLLVHHRELKRTSNTGRFVKSALTNSQIFVRGIIDQPLNFEEVLKPNYRHLLFYPVAGARELNQDLIQESSLPIHLIVPDGNWRQASKVVSRHPELANVPKVMISEINLAQNHLRTEHADYGMATLQAVAKALGIIEDEAVREHLMRIYDLKLSRTRHARGLKP